MLRRPAVCLFIALLLSGCVGPGAPPASVSSSAPSTARPTSPVPASTAPSSAAATRSPAEEPSTASPASTGSVSPSSEPVPSPTETITSGNPATPPLGVLNPADSVGIPGELGSYTYDGAGSDSPWLPARGLEAVPVTTGSTLTLTLQDGSAFGMWTVRASKAANEDGIPVRGLASGGDDAATVTAAEIHAPPAGSWVVAATLYFPQEGGDATYYWLLDVTN